MLASPAPLERTSNVKRYKLTFFLNQDLPLHREIYVSAENPHVVENKIEELLQSEYVWLTLDRDSTPTAVKQNAILGINYELSQGSGSLPEGDPR